MVERKPDGFKDREARKTVVAFANSTPEDQEAVLFIGVHDKSGEVLVRIFLHMKDINSVLLFNVSAGAATCTYADP